MQTPASTKELRQQLDSLGLGDVYILDVESDREHGISTLDEECVTVWYWIDEVFPTHTEILIPYLESTFYRIERGGGLPGEFEEISIPDFPYDETWKIIGEELT